jgi:outer membrane protein with beta-barrel domain
MMTTKRVFFASALAALLVIPAAARADVILTPFAGVSFGGDTSNTKGAFGGSISFMGPVVGLELDFSHTPDFFGDDSNVTKGNATTFMANIKFAPHVRGRGVQPYVSGGIGLLRTRLEAEDLFDNVTSNDWGFNLGFGVGGYFSPHVGLQGDVRYFRAFQDIDLADASVPVSNFDFWRASVGLTFKF